MVYQLTFKKVLDRSGVPISCEITIKEHLLNTVTVSH